MKKCAIIIGINDTPGMPYLSSPCHYARRVDLWARSQGFQTRLFTDESFEGNKHRINIRDISTAGAELLTTNPEQLLVYFAGHGIELEPGNDIWLLPDYQRWPSEAINISKNKDILFKSGVTHSIFISDACRSPRTNREDRIVLGSEIFPSLHRTNYDAVIDVLYSTWPGEASIDYRDENGNYISVYSECLLECLYGSVAEVIRHIELQDGYDKFPAVISRDLSKYLKQTVPIIIKQKTKKNQQPNSSVNSDEPIYISRFNKGNVEVKEDIISGLEMSDSFDNDSQSSTIAQKLQLTNSLPSKILNRKIKNNIRIIDEVHRTMVNDYSLPENRTGIIIHGNRRATIYGINDYFPRFFDFYNNEQLIDEVDVINFLELHNTTNYMPIILVGSNGGKSYYPMTILPNFINSMIFDRGNLISIDYYPTRGNRRMNAIYDRIEVAKRKAEVVTAAANGIFQGAEELAGYLPLYKNLDTTLGLFAAYAYYQNGKFENIRSLYSYMNEEDEPILPEVSALNQLANRDRPLSSPHNPIIPMLTQGWSYLDTQQNEITYKLQNFLRPGLWTSFGWKGLESIKFSLEKLR